MELKQGKLSNTIVIIIARKHGNVGREPHHAFIPEEVTQITLIRNHSEANAMLLPI